MTIEMIQSKSIAISSNVWQSTEELTYLSNKEIKAMQKYSQSQEIRQFRYCLHTNNQEGIQKMIIFHNRPQVINWHGQLNQQGCISYICIEGSMEIVVNMNYQKRVFKLDSIDNSSINHLSIPKNYYRRVITNSECSIFWEIGQGPFRDSDTIWTSKID